MGIQSLRGHLPGSVAELPPELGHVTCASRLQVVGDYGGAGEAQDLKCHWLRPNYLDLRDGDACSRAGRATARLAGDIACGPDLRRLRVKDA